MNGITAFRGFRFHQSRCTFATELARVAMKHGSVGMAVQLVRQALLHKSEKTTLTYIRFIEKTDAMSGMADWVSPETFWDWVAFMTSTQ